MKSLVALFSLLLMVARAWSIDDTTKLRSIFDDFYQPNQIVDVTLQFDIKPLIRQKEKKEKFSATITYQRADGEHIVRPIEIKTRGKLRLSVCNFPPLKLDFDKSELAAEGFLSEFDDLKMVTHCQNFKNNDQLVLKELLVYQMYNLLSEYSLRTQLLHVRYLNADSTLYAEEYALLLESAEALAYRLNCRKSEKRIESISELKADCYNKMVLFEYMIGNVDWNIAAQHNVEIFKSLNGGFRVVVPYDFDYSGVVNANYAVPDDRVGQKMLGERVLVSDFTSEEAMQQAVQAFLEKEAAILNVCQNLQYLPETEREAVTKYLNKFFDFIKMPRLTTKKFTNHGGFK